MNLKPEKKLAKFAGIVIAFLTLVIWAASVSPVGAQTCQGFGPDGRMSVYVAGLQIPNAGNVPDPAFATQWCMPNDYSQVYRRHFGQYGVLDWVPMAGVPYGGFWGQAVPGGYQPVLSGDGQPLTGRQRIERGAGIAILGGAIGNAAGGERGGWIGFAAGVGAALINDSRYRGRDNAPAPQPQPTTPTQPTVQIPPSPYPPDYQPPVAHTPVRPVRYRSEDMVEVKNPFRYDVEVWHSNDSNTTWFIRRNTSRRLPWPPEGERFEGRFRKPRNGGGWNLEDVQINADGPRFVLDPPEE